MSAPFAIIVAHGSPGDPDPVDRSVKALAGQVAALAPQWRVGGATLAKPGSLASELALAVGSEAVVIYPFFMSNGWFVQTELRRRVAAGTQRRTVFLEPLGLDPALPELCIRVALERLQAEGRSPAEAALVLAAHGSANNAAPAAAARRIQDEIGKTGIFGVIRLGFVEEQPSIADAASGLAGRVALCLPLFATVAGHVTGDVPEQLAEAHFEGTLLPPIGADSRTPGLIARSLMAATVA
jgi:sirohydrochlorin ferrochelatase